MIVAADACKNSVTEYYTSTGGLPANLAAAGCATQVTQYVGSITMPAAGSIVVTTGAGIPAAAAGNLALTPTANAGNASILDWACNAAAGTTIPSKFLPAHCR
jgi:type IV pilus assembly protein PilA